jgi:F-type H+-transporting ATPase subunit alpha
VYVAIGQKLSTVANVVHTLEARGALANCVVVVAGASDSAPMQYIAPFAGCAMAEYFRDGGGDALVVYDDLYKHAVAYRQISLVLRRPSGREAFPGDIFYLHSRLLERAAKLNAARGGGSLTALPIVETQQGDYAAYIPTNLISITDGQIYLENELFYQGFRPAINVGLSVSRVGGKAQLASMKAVALKLRLEFAQYRELAAFARLTTDVDPATQAQLNRGARIAEILKQPAHQPLAVEREVVVLWAALRGHLDDVPLGDVPRCEQEWLRYLEAAQGAVLQTIRGTEALTAESEAGLTAAMAAFKRLFVPTGMASSGS